MRVTEIFNYQTNISKELINKSIRIAQMIKNISIITNNRNYHSTINDNHVYVVLDKDMDTIIDYGCSCIFKNEIDTCEHILTLLYFIAYEKKYIKINKISKI